MTPKALIDSDVLSAVFRGHAAASARARAYLADHSRPSFAVITRYEILRGLKAVRATTRQLGFERFCAASEIFPLTDPIVDRASEIYADLHQRGQLIGDADILIAATALEHGLQLVTHNASHFGRIAGLTILTWL